MTPVLDKNTGIQKKLVATSTENASLQSKKENEKTTEQKAKETRGDRYTDFQKCETGVGQQVTRIHTSQIIIIIIIIIISFMQGIYTYIPETNYVPREYSIATILLLLFMVLISLVPVLNLLYFTLIFSELFVQCTIWLFSVVP